MTNNFQIAWMASVPWLEVNLSKNGLVPLAMQAPDFSCGPGKTDPNLVDLTDAESVSFQMFKPGRTPAPIGMSGICEFIEEQRAVGGVRYKFHPNDTTLRGTFYGQFTATFKDGTVFKWPYQLESLSIGVL